MSASHRRLVRLPLDVFKSLLFSEPNQEMTPQELRQSICEKLKRFRIRSKRGSMSTMSVKTVGDILRTPRFNLLQALDPLLTFGEIELMIKRICQQCSPNPVNCLTLLARTTTDLKSVSSEPARFQPSSLTPPSQLPENSLSSVGDRMRYLSTGLHSLDRNGDGGIRLGNITEIVGRAGAGKTQFALQLVLMAARYNQGAMYFDTEKKLMLSRLKDMAARRWNSEGASANHLQQYDGADASHDHEVTFDYKRPDKVLENMTVKQPSSTKELLEALRLAEEEILHRNHQGGFPVRVLIVDSIASPLKRDFGPNAIPQRAATAFSIAQTLKRYAEQLHLAVIVINQVGIDGHSAPSGGEGRRHDQVAVRASLGTSWYHCVATRILLDHEVDPHRDGWRPQTSPASQQRSLSVVKSNWMPFTKISFQITPTGIEQSRQPSQLED